MNSIRKVIAVPGLFDPELSKSQERKIQIIEAVIRLFVTEGIENITYERIAKESGASRPLVIHYFPDREELFTIVAKYIRAVFQKDAVDAIVSAVGPRDSLEAYIRSTFQSLRKRPDHFRVWLLFYYYSGIRKSVRQLNSELVKQGHDRITALLEEGIAQKVFSFKSRDKKQIAKNIQIQITGALVSLLTEDLGKTENELEEYTVQNCLRSAGTFN